MQPRNRRAPEAREGTGTCLNHELYYCNNRETGERHKREKAEVQSLFVGEFILIVCVDAAGVTLGHFDL